mmetsp:Transcript_73245/g.238226  ORF Transcript_73245/g.238226 Transcript_73245/m.238226 type:complete len:296 (-) Transcript_73245:49-936(-)
MAPSTPLWRPQLPPRLLAVVLTVISLTASSEAAVSTAGRSEAQLAQAVEKQIGRRWWPFDSGSDVMDADSGLGAENPLASSSMVQGPEGDAAFDEALPRPQPSPAARSRAPRAALLRLSSSSVSSGSAAARGVLTPDAPDKGWGSSSPTAELAGPVTEYDVDGPSAERRLMPDSAAVAARRAALLVARRSVTKVRSQAMTLTALEGEMEDKCLKFASWAKSQDLEGPELIAVWKSTCSPAVLAGAATPQYATMCEALSSAVAEFSEQPNWTPDGACKRFLAVFRESGIGRSPVSG